MKESIGASASPTGLSSLRDEAGKPSSPKASIPSAGMFGVLDGYCFEVVTITKVTEQCFWHIGQCRDCGSREVRAYRDKLVCWSTGRAAADLASKRLVSAEAERDRRLSAARVSFEREKAKIAASAMSAGTAETAQQAQGQRPASAAPEGGDARHD